MTTRHTTRRGIIFMILAQICFVGAWSAVKHVGQRLPLFEVLFFRGFFSLIILLPATLWRARTLHVKSKKMVFLRSFFGYIAMILSFYAIINMEMGDAASLFNTLPIFVALLAPPLLREPFGRKQFIFIITAFAGILMILKPTSGIVQTMSVYALLAGFISSISMICIRKIHEKDSSWVIALYFTIFTAIASAPMAIATYIPPTPTEWALLGFVGFMISLAQIFLTKAYKLGEAATIAPFNYTFVIGSYITGLMIFSEMPDAISIGGACVIVGSGIAIMLTAPKRQSPPGATPATRI